MKSSTSQEDHLFSVISADPSTAEKHSSKIPCKGVEFWSRSLFTSEWSTVVWVWTCYLLIQIFWPFFWSECTSSNTATSVSCETTKLLDAWLFTGGIVSASSGEASKWHVSVSGLGDPIWVALLKPPPAKIVLSIGVCSMSGKDDTSFIYFRILLTGWEPLFIFSWFHVWSRFRICQCTWKHVWLAGETW